MVRTRTLDELKSEDRERLLSRSNLNVDSVKAQVVEILRNVKERGDEALLEYTSLYDKVDLKKSEIHITRDEFKAARENLPEKVMSALRYSAKNLEVFHRAQLPQGMISVQPREGVILKDVWMPVGTVGVYATRGLPSTCLMVTVPGKVVGVERLNACTAPGRNGNIEPSVLTALDLGGVGEAYRVGGAQAIAAMAYGTETVQRADKIVGPGNVYVIAAKLLVQGFVGTDLPAGPSEIAIIADNTADPKIVALDLLSQLEHGMISASESYALLVTTSKNLARSVAANLEQSRIMDAKLERLLDNTSIITCNNIEEAVAFINEYAPEHLEVITENPERVVTKIRNVGSIFIGSCSAVAAGDYATGANHVLPTGRAARFTSGLSVYDYLKRITVQEVTRTGLAGLLDTVSVLAETEGLPGHADAVRARVK